MKREMEASVAICRVKITNVFSPIILLLFEVAFIYGAIHSFGVLSEVIGSAIVFVILFFILGLSAIILPIVITNKMIRYQRCFLGNEGLHLERKGIVPFGAIKSYDTDAAAFGETGRLYLHLRPWKGMAFRLTPSLKKDERHDFMKLCLAFQQRMEQARALGATDAPAQQSFWGSRRAKSIGLLGLGLEAVMLVGTLIIAPHMISYAGYALVVATPIFLAILAGKRSR